MGMYLVESVVLGLYGICLGFIFCYSLVQLQLTWLYLRHRQPLKPTLPLQNFPRVTIQLPLYNERYVVERLIDAVMAIRYPAGMLEVQVLDDSTDDTRELVAHRVAAYQALGRDILQIRRSERTGYKAGALAYGLESAKGEFMAIFDADFLPEPDFLEKTIPEFDSPEVGVVQTRWGHLNQDYSLLTELQAFGLNAHFTIEQSGRNRGGHFINFNGTAGVWRKSCIEDAGGWQSDTLTEDLDLSYRAQVRYWKFKYLEQVAAPAELPASMPAVKSQQYRWMKGGAETARKNLGRVLASKHPLLTKMNGLFHLLNSSVFPAVFLAGVLSVPILFLNHRLPFRASPFQFSFSYVISVVALFSFYWISFRQRNAPTLHNSLLFLPRFFLFLTVSLGLSLHNSLAVLEGFQGRRTPFIRTPKFNLRKRQDSWKGTVYTIHRIPYLTWFEGLMALYFGAGFWFGIWRNQYSLLPFHFMLCLGFGLVFYYSVRHSQ